MIDKTELARRSILGLGEMMATLGRWGAGPEAEVRWPNALGARVEAAADNPWFDGAVVLPGLVPPEDDPRLPHCLWTVADSVPGRVERFQIATPCLGVDLDDPGLMLNGGATDVATPSLGVVGDVNEHAYGNYGVFGTYVRAIRDDRIQTHGLLDGDEVVCVALTMAIDDDLSIQYVATKASHRRQGLASRLLIAVLAKARAEGMQTATLQASPDGLSVYERLGFHRVALLRGFLRLTAKR